MATLERPSPASAPPAQVAQPASSSSFDPAAVPLGPTALARLVTSHDHDQHSRGDGDDLVQLGQEQLFSGARTGGARDQVAREGDGAGGSVGARHRPAESSQELLGSLGAAKHVFLSALSSLLHDHLGATSRPVSALVEGVPTASTSTSSPPPPNPFADPPAPTFQPADQRTADEQGSPLPPQNPPDIVLSALVGTLRRQSATSLATPLPPMSSVERVSPLIGSRRSAQSSASADGALLEELQARIEVTAGEILPPTEADLARTLASLLICIERLAVISRFDEPHGRTSRASRPASPVQPSSNVYEALEREAAALIQSGKDQPSTSPEAVVGAVRQVEQAERDLLWGRVDDLSERVKLLSRRRAEGAEALEHEPRLPENEYGELPSYSRHGDAAGQSHLPPAYYGDGAELADDKKGDVVSDIKPAPPHSPSRLAPSAGTSTRTTARIRKVSSANSEKMQRDLDSVSEAIERLYVVSPQLANQRVEPDRRKVRERQLVKLGNAIERLSQGRLEDQRAVAIPAEEEAEEDEQGVTGEERRRAQTVEREQRAIDRMLDQIDRAASRTLADQRVELNGKRKTVIGDLLDTEPEIDDKYETRRRTYILEHTGKGRFDSQDAKLQTRTAAPSSSSPFPVSDEPVTINEFFAGEQPRRDGVDGDDSSPQRSQSLPVVRKKFSSPSLFRAKLAAADEPTASTASTVSTGKNGSSLRSGLFKKPAALAIAGRRGSFDANIMTGLGVFGTTLSRTSSTTGTEILDVPAFDWVTEESRNLGTLVVTFWPRSAAAGKRAADEYDVVAVESDSVLVTSVQGGPASRLSLPCQVVPQKATVTSAAGAVYEIKLVTAGLSSPTKSRADLEVHTPLSTDELRATAPASFHCAMCDIKLVDATRITRYNALPSEHWAELLDAWMCHQDQTLSDDLIAKGKGIKPRDDEGLVGTSYVLLPRAVTSNWASPDVEPTKADNGDLIYPAHCSTCSTLIGASVCPVDSTVGEPTALRLLKYATYPVSSSIDTPATRHSLSSYVTAELLETGQAHACHRFVLEDAETEKARLLLWFFNPAIRVAFSTTASAASALEPPTSSSPSASASSSPDVARRRSTSTLKTTTRSLNAVKVFYTDVKGDSDPACLPFTQAKNERVAYPRAVLDRVDELLRASTLVYPPSKRRFGDLAVGFLERI
ncbi:hypothetical protein JCM3775_001223 [Rhodotorula graminis]|uniref:HECT-like ubiquitin-conjugating enzyme-binding-domain-containing protein n=1 Tax=Rhodotorula graminis (strain WP1) TaxID=578459 RepID=A0A194S7U3_RHOGW|nr:uncharacterized protein RHOBADRAFT_53448 [Rhodotorula graminis WP1]KPV75476.1 hypothetical protein RHOBADRAFT_53448 [Rhodotorula graminis WP1]